MNLEELTDYIIASANDDYIKLVKLMIECAKLIPFQLPPPGMAGIIVARQYWIEQSAPESEVERARVNCWNYLDERSASTNTEAPEYCAIRAVICLLYVKPPSKDNGELICFFYEMLRGVLHQENDEVFIGTVVSVTDRFFDKKGKDRHAPKE